MEPTPNHSNARAGDFSSTISPFELFPPFEMDSLFSPNPTLDSTSASSPTKTPLRDPLAPPQGLLSVIGPSSGSPQGFSPPEAHSNTSSKEDMLPLKDLSNSPFPISSVDSTTSFTPSDHSTSTTRLSTPWKTPEMFTVDRQDGFELDSAYQFSSSTAFRRPLALSQQRSASSPAVPIMSKSASSHTYETPSHPNETINFGKEHNNLSSPFDTLRTCSLPTDVSGRPSPISPTLMKDPESLQYRLRGVPYGKLDVGGSAVSKPSTGDVERDSLHRVVQSSVLPSTPLQTLSEKATLREVPTATEWICSADGCKAFNFSRTPFCIACGLHKLDCGPALSSAHSNTSSPPHSASSNCTTFSFRSSHSSCPSYDKPQPISVAKLVPGSGPATKPHHMLSSAAPAFHLPTHDTQAPAASSMNLLTANRPLPKVSGLPGPNTLYATRAPPCQIQQRVTAPVFSPSALGGSAHRKGCGSPFPTASEMVPRPKALTHITSPLASSTPYFQSAPPPSLTFHPHIPQTGPSFTTALNLHPQSLPSLVHPTSAHSIPSSGAPATPALPSSATNALQALLTPSGNALAFGGRVQNISGDPINPVLMFWPDHEPLPNKGQLRPPNPCYAKVEGTTKHGGTLTGVATPPPIMNTGNQGPMARQALDWECLVCGYVNWRRRKVCQMCFPYAPGNEPPASHSNRMNVITALLSVANAQQQRVNAQVQALSSTQPRLFPSSGPNMPPYNQVRSDQKAISRHIPPAMLGDNISLSSNSGVGGGYCLPEPLRLSQFNLKQAGFDTLGSNVMPSLDHTLRGTLDSPASSPSTLSSSTKSNSGASASGSSWLSSSPLWSCPDVSLSSSSLAGQGWPQTPASRADILAPSPAGPAPFSRTALSMQQPIARSSLLENVEGRMLSKPDPIGSGLSLQPHSTQSRSLQIGSIFQSNTSAPRDATANLMLPIPGFQGVFRAPNHPDIMSSGNNWSIFEPSIAESAPVRPTLPAAVSLLTGPSVSFPYGF